MLYFKMLKKALLDSSTKSGQAGILFLTSTHIEVQSQTDHESIIVSDPLPNVVHSVSSEEDSVLLALLIKNPSGSEYPFSCRVYKLLDEDNVSSCTIMLLFIV